MIPTKKVSLANVIWIRRAMKTLALIGLFASVYLLITYVSGAPIACGIVSGCEIVRASKWAHTLGVPRPLLGVIYYLAILGLLVARTAYGGLLYRQRLQIAAWIIAFVGFIESGFLTMIQWLDVKAFCIWCLTSAVTAIGIFILSFFESEEQLDRAQSNKELKVFFGTLLSATVVGGFLLWVLLYRTADGELPKLENKTDAAPSAEVMKQLVPEGTPTEGSVTSSLTIVEFIDFECPSCRLFHPTMKKIREEYAGKIRFAYRPFMLPEIHPHAKGAAIAYECSIKQGRPFPFADLLIANQAHLERADLMNYAKSLNMNETQFASCLDDANVANLVVEERKFGESLGVQGTPTLFMNDAMLDGIPSEDQFKQLIDQAITL
jgi:protein-disulfide isomerase/uncharacterized membrane protein